MITPIQELIKELKYVQEFPMISGIIKRAELLLEKEKEHIIDAYRSGHSDRSFEKYNPYFYEETYNQKQITYERIN
jgi:hypothetical protein